MQRNVQAPVNFPKSWNVRRRQENSFGVQTDTPADHQTWSCSTELWRLTSLTRENMEAEKSTAVSEVLAEDKEEQPNSSLNGDCVNWFLGVFLVTWV